MLKFYYGTMGSGKSLHLLATAHNFSDRHINYLIFKSSIDNRDGENTIHSRALGDKECITIMPETNLYSLTNTLTNISSTQGHLIKWILVDEAQFLTPDQVEELGAVSDNLGINVMCYGLRTDFQTNMFPGSQRLFEIADSIEEIKSSCNCDRKTIFNARFDTNGKVVLDGEQVEVGGDERYIALCRKCYFTETGHYLYQKEEDFLDEE